MTFLKDLNKKRGQTQHHFLQKSGAGFGLIEVVVGLSLISITLIGLISTYNLFLEAALKNTKRVQSAYLLEEGLEAIRSIRDESWDTNISSLTIGNSYGFSFNGSKWTTTYGAEVIDNIFYREVIVSNVLRDANDDISSSGTLDSNTKFFTVNVLWLEGGATTTKSISTYLTKLF